MKMICGFVLLHDGMMGMMQLSIHSISPFGEGAGVLVIFSSLYIGISLFACAKVRIRMTHYSPVNIM